MPSPPDPIERFAHVEPPQGHARRVLACSGPATAARRDASAAPRPAPWRWVLPVAATLVVAVGAYVQSDRVSRAVPLEVPPPDAAWSGKGVDVPVLPPRAYWEMSAVDEFARLRPDATETSGDGRGTRRENSETRTGPALREMPTAALSRNVAFNTPGPDAAPVQAEPIAVEAFEIEPIPTAPGVALAPIPIESIAIRPLAEEAP